MSQARIFQQDFWTELSHYNLGNLIVQSQKIIFKAKPSSLHCLLQYTGVSVKHKPDNVHVLRQGREALQVFYILEDSLLGAISSQYIFSLNSKIGGLTQKWLHKHIQAG
jgi:hypothetical protein